MRHAKHAEDSLLYSGDVLLMRLQKIVHQHLLRALLALGLFDASESHPVTFVGVLGVMVLRRGDDDGVDCVVTHHHFLLLLCVHCDLINVFVVSMVAVHGCHGGSLLAAGRAVYV